MPRGGLSTDKDKRARQLAALDAGRDIKRALQSRGLRRRKPATADADRRRPPAIAGDSPAVTGKPALPAEPAIAGAGGARIVDGRYQEGRRGREKEHPEKDDAEADLEPDAEADTAADAGAGLGRVGRAYARIIGAID